MENATAQAQLWACMQHAVRETAQLMVTATREVHKADALLQRATDKLDSAALYQRTLRRGLHQLEMYLLRLQEDLQGAVRFSACAWDAMGLGSHEAAHRACEAFLEAQLERKQGPLSVHLYRILQVLHAGLPVASAEDLRALLARGAEAALAPGGKGSEGAMGAASARSTAPKAKWKTSRRFCIGAGPDALAQVDTSASMLADGVPVRPHSAVSSSTTAPSSSSSSLSSNQSASSGGAATSTQLKFRSASARVGARQKKTPQVAGEGEPEGPAPRGKDTVAGVAEPPIPSSPSDHARAIDFAPRRPTAYAHVAQRLEWEAVLGSSEQVTSTPREGSHGGDGGDVMEESSARFGPKAERLPPAGDITFVQAGGLSGGDARNRRAQGSHAPPSRGMDGIDEDEQPWDGQGPARDDAGGSGGGQGGVSGATRDGRSSSRHRRRFPAKTRLHPKFAPDVLLTSKVFWWLAGLAGEGQLDDRIYVCVEQRQQAMPSEAGAYDSTAARDKEPEGVQPSSAALADCHHLQPSDPAQVRITHAAMLVYCQAGMPPLRSLRWSPTPEHPDRAATEGVRGEGASENLSREERWWKSLHEAAAPEKTLEALWDVDQPPDGSSQGPKGCVLHFHPATVAHLREATGCPGAPTSRWHAAQTEPSLGHGPQDPLDGPLPAEHTHMSKGNHNRGLALFVRVVDKASRQKGGSGHSGRKGKGLPAPGGDAGSTAFGRDLGYLRRLDAAELAELFCTYLDRGQPVADASWLWRPVANVAVSHTSLATTADAHQLPRSSNGAKDELAPTRSDALPPAEASIMFLFCDNSPLTPAPGSTGHKVQMLIRPCLALVAACTPRQVAPADASEPPLNHVIISKGIPQCGWPNCPSPAAILPPTLNPAKSSAGIKASGIVPPSSEDRAATAAAILNSAGIPLPAGTLPPLCSLHAWMAERAVGDAGNGILATAVAPVAVTAGEANGPACGGEPLMVEFSEAWASHPGAAQGVLAGSPLRLCMQTWEWVVKWSPVLLQLARSDLEDQVNELINSASPWDRGGVDPASGARQPADNADQGSAGDANVQAAASAGVSDALEPSGSIGRPFVPVNTLQVLHDAGQALAHRLQKERQMSAKLQALANLPSQPSGKGGGGQQPSEFQQELVWLLGLAGLKEPPGSSLAAEYQLGARLIASLRQRPGDGYSGISGHPGSGVLSSGRVGVGAPRTNMVVGTGRPVPAPTPSVHPAPAPIPGPVSQPPVVALNPLSSVATVQSTAALMSAFAAPPAFLGDGKRTATISTLPPTARGAKLSPYLQPLGGGTAAAASAPAAVPQSSPYAQPQPRRLRPSSTRSRTTGQTGQP
eukprot:jgi/Mesvir1/18375/Mv14260-RA.2